MFSLWDSRFHDTEPIDLCLINDGIDYVHDVHINENHQHYVLPARCSKHGHFWIAYSESLS